MFTSKGCIVLFTCVVATQATCWRTFGYQDDSCGLESGESLCDTTTDSENACKPLVVRPQEVPKPEIQTTLTPIPGPCACKKAIVKPAILPKPVCKPIYHKCSEGDWYGASTSCGSSKSHSCHHTKSTHNCYGDKIVSHHSGVWAPADAVSIAIAQQNSQRYCNLDEDRLSFGFRKIPIEIPKQKIIRQNNIPEEKIFSLNGQIVELKPVKVCCSGKSIDEEAAEDLLALEEEEETDCASAVGEDETCSPIKMISLGQLGYVPSKGQKKTFADVEETEDSADTTTDTEESSSSSGTASSSGYKSGKVVYKTVTKPATLTIANENAADCDSSEGEEQSIVYEEEHKHKGHKPHRCGIVPCTCGYPRSYHSSSSSSSSSSSKVKKASVIVQKLCSN